jgi:ATP-dependent DNA helicase RecG
MTIEQLRQRLNQIEWRDIEFKRARGGVPQNAFETVAAFSNTTGGHLVFGVEEGDGKFEIVGVLDPEKIQSDFLSALRSGQILSCVIPAEESRMEDEGKVVLAFFIPEARREQKPVHLRGELRKSFIRRAGGDERCNEDEIKRFIRDADQRSFDSEPMLGIDPATCLDTESLTWYRAIFNRRSPAHETEGLDDLGFIHHFGLLVDDGKSRHLTRAAILLFGNSGALQKTLSRAVADIRLLNASADETLPEERWDHRMLLEENLTKCWRRGVQFFMDRIGDRPFTLDASTLHGGDAPPDYLAFREAFLNLLTHQDFGDPSRKAIITVHRDQLLFWNPGASYVCGEALFSPGEKTVRNPRIRSMLQRIGIGEQAGTGFRAIYGNQRKLGRLPPTLSNDRSDQSFQIILSKKLVASQRQQWVAQRLGANLSDAEAAVFLQALREEALGPLETASIVGLNPTDTGKLLERLVQQQLLEIHPGGQGRSFRPKPVFLERAHELLAPISSPPVAITPGTSGNLVASQAAQPAATAPGAVTAPPAAGELARPTLAGITILQFCRGAGRSVPAIMEKAGFSHRSHFKTNSLDPLVDAGLLRPTQPDNPRHPDQGYATTEKGIAMLVSLGAGQTDSPTGSLVTEKVIKPETGEKQ